MLHETRNKVYIYGIQAMFVVILCGAQGLTTDNMKVIITSVARFTVYFLLINTLNRAITMALSRYQNGKTIKVKILIECKLYIMMLAASTSMLLYNRERVFDENFIPLSIAYLVIKYPEINQNLQVINYGVGMACSFFEGYLVHVIPNDGHNFFGLENNILVYEGTHTVVFPVKKLLIVVTKSLFCPPDLKHFNKINKDLPYLDDCSPLSKVTKHVAGVRDRVYKNSPYKIIRSGARPVYVIAECATPLHTLKRVLDKTAVYKELANVDKQELSDDFCEMLESIIERSPEYRGKCELVFFDGNNLLFV
nr:stimulator of interferon genes protein-like isoform X1 [Danaus plexippus plexippus]